MSKFSNSVDLAKTSLAVLNKDKVLAVIPLVSVGHLRPRSCCSSAAGAYATLETVADPAAGTNATDPAAPPRRPGRSASSASSWSASSPSSSPACSIAGANERLEGGDPTFGSAFSKAGTRVGSLLGWAAINATVGHGPPGDPRARRHPRRRRQLASAGRPGTIITWLTVPVIIVEGLGPIDAIKRSAHLLKQTWGENLIAQIGLGAIGFLLMLPGLIVVRAALAGRRPCRHHRRRLPLDRARRHPDGRPRRRSTARRSTATPPACPPARASPRRCSPAPSAPREGIAGRFN